MNERTVTIPLDEYNGLIEYRENSCVCVKTNERFGDTYYYDYKTENEAIKELTDDIRSAERSATSAERREAEEDIKRQKDIMKSMSIWQFIKWRKR
ncbi:MAG: hypothetical protein JRJ00_00110 [Deltaproteobacteria bacterium]|nr:hypothetical protein [Deltaproteobacteria bacterium]